jgi:hypothetical protein
MKTPRLLVLSDSNTLKIRPRSNLEDLTGKEYSEFIVLGEAARRRQPSGQTRRYWTVRCSCGTIKELPGTVLKNKNTKSCGCKINNWHRLHKGYANPNWKGGRRVEGGYVLIYQPDHPKSKTNGYVREHVLVMENKIGRSLVRQENVHHINGDKQDNRPVNLELWSTSQPPGQRVADKLAWAKEMIELYE